MLIKFPAISIVLRSPISIRIQRFSRPVGRPKGSVNKPTTPTNSPAVKQWHLSSWSVSWAVLLAMTQGEPQASRDIALSVDGFNGRKISTHYVVVEISRLVNKGILVRLRRGLFLLPHSIEEVDGVGVVTHNEYVPPPLIS